MTNMYKVDDHRMKTYNPFRGCEFDCVYCESSFKRQAKRDKHRCELCYNFTPHFHPERLKQSLPKNTTVFVCSMGDISFATPEERDEIYEKLSKHPSTTFMIQSKDPKCFIDEDIPVNVYIGTTIETNRDTTQISKAPPPVERYEDILEVDHPNIYITVEPVLDFDELLIDWICEINPDEVFVGYDNHSNHLPEPSLIKTRALCADISTITNVYEKTMRLAWWE